VNIIIIKSTQQKINHSKKSVILFTWYMSACMLYRIKDFAYVVLNVNVYHSDYILIYYDHKGSLI
jgi:hypothetical protein